jgi:hypothetical protein
MQHLRREFDKAQLLLQYVLERENLNKASFDVDQEIFEQKLFDLNVPLSDADSNMTSSSSSMDDKKQTVTTSTDYSSISSATAADGNFGATASEMTVASSSTASSSLKRRRPVPYHYSIQCKELVLTSGSDMKADPFEYITPYVPNANSRKDHSNSRYSTSIKTEKNLKDSKLFEVPKKKSSHLNGSVLGVDGDSVLGLSHQGDDGSVALSAIDKPKKRKSSAGTYSGRNRQVSGDFDSRIHGMIVETPYSQPSAANIIDIGAYHADVSAMRIPDLTSSLGRLNQWASKQVSTFLHPLSIRDKLVMNTSSFTAADYMRDLEFRPAESINTMSTTTLPLKYRCRGRIGRGGRLVMDRIPVSFP